MTDLCHRGHPRTPENTYVRTRVRPDRKATTMRVCRPCQAEAQRLSAARRWSWEKVHAVYVDLVVDVRLGGMSVAQRRARTGL